MQCSKLLPQLPPKKIKQFTRKLQLREMRKKLYSFILISTIKQELMLTLHTKFISFHHIFINDSDEEFHSFLSLPHENIFYPILIFSTFYSSFHPIHPSIFYSFVHYTLSFTHFRNFIIIIIVVELRIGYCGSLIMSLIVHSFMFIVILSHRSH